MDWKTTLNLPDAESTIPMKADLATREPAIQIRWDEMGLYHRIQESRQGKPTFVLHDGPPYTNGPVHIGTAMNKMLKDFVVKSRTMMGYECPYVPGYDNHGLPIEQAVLAAWVAELREKSGAVEALGLDAKAPDTAVANALKQDRAQLIARCRAHASRFIETQTTQFKRLGVLGLWETPYQTMGFRYEAELVRIFSRLAQRGLVYKGLRPVLWSTTSKTALADTEIVYEDVKSHAIDVKFALRNDPHNRFANFPNLHTIIWTTTPWTLPANVACAFHPDFDYAIVRTDHGHFVVLHELAARVMQRCGLEPFEEVGFVKGSDLEGLSFQHPFLDRESLAVMADYVTAEDGTGVVHTAPGHGREDFITGLKCNLPILCPVDENGMMTAEAGPFAGNFYVKANKLIVEHLRESGALLHSGEITHSYPHGERDGQPVIFRTTEQWFISMDAENMRETMLGEIRKVQWLPDGAINRIEAMVANRPDWCISRQRPWGVGIPVFYGKESGRPVMDGEVFERVANAIEQGGSNAWFEKSVAELLPSGYKHPETGETEFYKETDVFDVWFDSGATSLCVLEGNVEPAWKASWPADLYLEGSDQHRGWFNTSLILGVGCRDQAPYRAVVTHGFVLDENREKMSKRRGNVVDPVDASNKFGADILRLWAASVDYSDDVPCGDNLLKQTGESYRTIRNTLRFLLANVAGFDPAAGVAPTEDLDRWIVEQTKLLVADSVDAYRSYDFKKVVKAVHNFCAVELSRFYLDAIKDRMYCSGTSWPERQSAQAACHMVLLSLVRVLAPILVHTAEETYARIPMAGHFDSVHLESFDAPEQVEIENIAGNELESRFARLLSIRAAVFAEFEQFKATGAAKDSQEVIASLTVSEDEAALLATFGADLANYFKMSAVEVQVGEPNVAFRVSEYAMCERSRLRRADVSEVKLSDGTTATLSARDQRVARELGLLA